jgi:hypothetical protein
VKPHQKKVSWLYKGWWTALRGYIFPFGKIQEYDWRKKENEKEIDTQ